MLKRQSRDQIPTRLPIVSSSDLLEDVFELSEGQKSELTSLYEDISSTFQVGKVLTGKVVGKDNSGVLVSIDYKSDGLIPQYEFSEFELKKLSAGDHIEVI